jgi:ATP-binding cassette subfamily B protein
VMVVPLIGLVPMLADRRASRIQRRSGDELAGDRRLAGDLFTLATTAATAKELRTYGLTGALGTRHAAVAEHVRARSVRSALRSAAWEGLGWICYAAGFVIVIIVLVLRAAHGHASPGQVVMAVSLMRRAQVQVSSASDTAGSLATAIRTARRLLWLETYVAESRPAASGTVPETLRAGIRLESVTFTYPGQDEPVLHDVDLDLPAGSTVAIVGENGAGKTTLVKLLTRMYVPDEGRIMVDGADLADLPPDEWRSRTTAVFQDFLRPSLPARQVVGVGDLPRMDDGEAIGSALARSGSDGLVKRLPGGLDTPLGRWFTGGQELSGGQWQRLALARGLMRPTPLLTVLDEPTAALDAAAETRLFERFAELARAGRESGGITLLISHRFSTVRMADLIVVLDRGRVAEAGGHDELLASGGTYAQLFTLQARAYLDGRK